MVNIGLFNDFSRSVNRSGRRCAGARFPGVKHYRGAAPITNPDVGALALAQACRALGEDDAPG